MHEPEPPGREGGVAHAAEDAALAQLAWSGVALRSGGGGGYGLLVLSVFGESGVDERRQDRQQTCRRHAYDLVRAYGEAGWTAHMVPLTVDGLIYASSMVMVDSRRTSGERLR